MKNAQAMTTAVVLLVSLSTIAKGADQQVGRIAAEAKCAQCHAAHDWEGEDAASLESLIQDIVAGKVKHKTRLELTESEIASIAAYWGQAGGRK